MKKLMSMLVLAAMLAASLVGCGGGETDTTTAAPAPTDKPAVSTTPQATPPTTVTEEPNTSEETEVPKVLGAGLEELIAGKTSLTATGKIDKATLASVGFNAWQTFESINELFDGIDTELEWFYEQDENGDYTILRDGADPENPDGTKRGGGPGKAGGGVSNPAYFYFGLTEKATITAYVLTTGNDNMDWTGRNPIEWTLYGTNDLSVFEECSIDGVEFDETKWTMLDYVYDGGIVEANFAGNGYEIDADKQGEFQYYVWVLGYTDSGNFQACELDFYVG
ncbi:MAG: hypothetical protein IJW62_02900 [Clostridia bacterium]|nr:hypothetical protein [Clostridia bacterium]